MVSGYLVYDAISLGSKAVTSSSFVVPAAHALLLAVLVYRPPSVESTTTARWQMRAIAVAVLTAACLGLIGDVLAGPAIGGSQSNPAYGALAAAVLVAAGTSNRRLVASVVLVAAVGHATALLSMPTEAAQGAALLAAMGIGASLVVGQLRTFASSADMAQKAAAQSERAPAGALIHDGLSILRLVTRNQNPPAALRAAAQATAEAERSWLGGESTHVVFADMLLAVAAEFPDLPMRVDMARLDSEPSLAVRETVIRAVRTLLANVRVHAHATHVLLEGFGGNAWTVRVVDDGCGFHEGTTARRAGLTIFTRDALTAAGLTFSLLSTPGMGTAGVITGMGDPPELRSDSSVSATDAAERVLHLACGYLLGGLWLMVAVGLPKVARTYAHPGLAVALVASVTLYLTLVWRRKQWNTSTVAWAGAALAGSAAGTVLTHLAGPSAMDGGNLGISVVAWSSQLLAMHLGRRWWWSLTLIAPMLPDLAKVSPTAAVGVLTWVTVAGYVAGRVSRALRDFGRETDAALARVVASERAAARGAVEKQVAALLVASSQARVEQEGLRRLAAALETSQRFLSPGRPDGLLSTYLNQRLNALDIPDGVLLVDLNQVEANLSPSETQSVCDAVAQIVTSRAQSGARILDVRTRGEGRHWEVSLIDEHWARPTIGDVTALLSKSTKTALDKGGVDVGLRAFPGGGCQIRLMRRLKADGG